MTIAVDETELARKRTRFAELLNTALGERGRLAVSFSGGVDSAVLLGLAAEVLGADRVLAVLGDSESLARRELRAARAVAAEIGVGLIEVRTNELAAADYQRNDVDRCYFCKDEFFSRLGADFLAAHDLQAVAFGENADDQARPDRPGARAATEHRVLRPLADAGMGKADVREIARRLGLSVAEKPAAPCLASRIPHGEPVTAEKLAQIEAAEEALIELGFTEVRVRHHGSIARIELPCSDLDRCFDPELRARMLAGVRAAGFANVTIDLAGLQSGAFTMKLLGLPSARSNDVSR